MACNLTSGKGDWETPDWLFERLNSEFDFAIDVAARADNAKLPTFISPEKNSLLQPWPRAACWANPPFQRGMKYWVWKAIREAQAGSTVVFLHAARTSTHWWHTLAQASEEIRFIRGRVTFKGAKHHAPFPCAVAILTDWGGPPQMSFMESEE